MMTLAAGTKLGRYEIRSKLGEGGMGEVYLAQDTTELGRRVAIKLLSSEVASDPKRMQRFVQEARTVSGLNHPNILTIYEFGQEGAARFITTEYVDGVTLREYMRAKGLKLHEVLDIAMQVAAALDAAHEAHVIHRDIKPDNIMIRRRDAIVKVLDFGLAKPFEKILAAEAPGVDSEAGTKLRVHTEPGVVMGTVNYMSPEQSQGSARADHRTDIWSLGAVLYEMVAGRVPFEGKDVYRQIIAIQEQALAPLSRYAAGVPERLEEIVNKALAKDPDERYQTAKDLLIDLRNLKRKLEFDAEIDRTVPPEMRATASTSGQSALATASGATAATVPAGAAHAASSAEYIVTGIKQHRLAVVIAVAVLAIGMVGLAAYLHARNTEVAIESIAVLPFANTTADPNTEYISDGITESIVNSLAKLPNLKIVSLISVARYKGQQIDPQAVGREINVRAVLVGKVTQRGDGLLVSAELVDVRDKSHIWGEQYNRKLSDILTVQQEISSEIAEQLRFKLSGEQQGQLTKRYTENPDAYQSYLKGRYYWNKMTGEGLKKALGYFQEAIDKDPNYALAYAGLADTYAYFGGAETLPKAKLAATKALEMDDTLGEAHAALGWIKLRYDLDWSGAEIEFKRAIQLNPNYAAAHSWYSAELMLMGRSDEAIAETKRAQELEPLSMLLNSVVGLPFYFSHQYDQAIAHFRKVIEMDPNFAWTHYSLGLAYRQKGMYQEAVTEFLQASTLWGDRPEYISALREAFAVSGWIGFLQKHAELQIEDSKKHWVDSYFIAVDFACLGEKEQALAWLEKAYDEKSAMLFWFRRDPAVDSLRSEPRFIALERRCNIPP